MLSITIAYQEIIRKGRYCKKALAAVPGGVFDVQLRPEDGALSSSFSGVRKGMLELLVVWERV